MGLKNEIPLEPSSAIKCIAERTPAGLPGFFETTFVNCVIAVFSALSALAYFTEMTISKGFLAFFVVAFYESAFLFAGDGFFGTYCAVDYGILNIGAGFNDGAFGLFNSLFNFSFDGSGDFCEA
jgi:hypothetical protein